MKVKEIIVAELSKFSKFKKWFKGSDFQERPGMFLKIPSNFKNFEKVSKETFLLPFFSFFLK
jgi:hypothetical protein